jgi:hypothetical protein
MVLEVRLLFVQEILGASVLFTSLVDQLISFARIFYGILPLEVKLMAFTM